MEAKCGCKAHEEFSKTSDIAPKLQKISAKKYKQRIIRALEERGYLSRATYLCTACAFYAESNFLDTDLTNKRQDVICKEVKTVVELLREGKLDENNLLLLANELGNSQRMAISSDAADIVQEKKYHDVTDLDAVAWICERNQVAVSFLKGCSGVDDFKEHPKKTLAIASCIDCLYSSCHLNVVTPLSFAAILVSHFVSGSKNVVDVMSQLYPCGSYGTVRNWVAKSAQEVIKCPPRKDLIAFMDNNQKLGRNWRVLLDAKAKVSVMTNIIHIAPSSLSMYQYDPALSPSSWLYNTKCTPTEIGNKINAFIIQCDAHFEELRNRFFHDRLFAVLAEQTAVDAVEITDLVDSVCSDASFEIPAGATDADDHRFLQHFHGPETPKVTMAEPCFANPCSYEAVEKVLSHIVDVSGVSEEERNWLAVGCDGSPFALAWKLMYRKPHLQNILLIPGLGHYEINMVKACFKLLWDVALSDLALMLGFKSDKAQASCQAATNHHKSWQILNIFFQGTCDELILPYVRQCMRDSVTPDLAGLYIWMEKATNPNFIFMKNIVATYLLSLFLFRSGVRRNNAECLVACRVKFSSLFYGLHMTTYQEINFLDLKTRVLCPKPIEEFLTTNESFSVSGHESKGEGGDFILEAKNRRVKMWLPPGIPSEQQWRTIIRNLDKLEMIKTTLKDLLSEKKPAKLYHPDLRREIIHWRTRLRQTGYLDPSADVNHRSVDGRPLDFELVNFSEHCKGNRNIFLENKVEPCEKRLIPVFVLSEDRDQYRHISNKTKDEIKDFIIKGITEIRQLGDNDEADFLMKTWEREIGLSTKEVFIIFYKRVLSKIEELSHAEDSEEEEEDDE